MEKGDLLYSGKAKSVYKTENSEQLVLLFRDDTSAFDGEKTDQLDRKGMVNNRFNAFIMQKLEEFGVRTHFIELLSEQESLVKYLNMLPVECVIRNIAAGSICKRLGLKEGTDLAQPIFEFFLKDDALKDPMINDSHILTFGWATQEQIDQMKMLTNKVNNILKPLFADAGLLLVDYKIEFGDFNGELLLGDEFTPDGCRLWDSETREKLDKDRFRRGLGGVVDAYEAVGQRLGIQF